MNRAYKQTILILGILSLGMLYLVCVICINEIKAFLLAFAVYIDSGRSLFVPDLPRVDLLWFLPPELQPVSITWGNVIDIIIFINIGLTLNKIPYDYYRRVKEGQIEVSIVDLHLDKRNEKKESTGTIDVNYSKPCIGPYPLLVFHSRKSTKCADRALKDGQVCPMPAFATNRTISRSESKHARVGILTRMALVFSRFFSFHVIYESYHRSGSCFSWKSSLHSIFEEIGAVKQ
ncbi:MAG: hypothetical protein Q6353_006205 [Candidatus Sigynarchaeum springense]